MAPRNRRKPARRATSSARPRPAARPRTAPSAKRSRPAPARAGRAWVGRSSSPVLDRYPPKAPEAPVTATARSVPAPPSRAAARPEVRASTTLPLLSPVSPGPPSAAPGSADASPPKGLIALARPFDIDEFAQSLGETQIRVHVPREDLAEVLRRVTDFMGFGIYVYAISVAPAAEESLKQFVVVLQRVDFSGARGAWVPFEEKGRSESPFGPDGAR
jgi:hypothetical protein